MSRHNLLTLQNLMKRDPGAYVEEFKQQVRHFESLVGVFQLDPAGASSFTHTTTKLTAFGAAACGGAAMGGEAAATTTSAPATKSGKEFAAQIAFMAHVVPSFKSLCMPEAARVPQQILALLHAHIASLPAMLRINLVHACAMLQKKDLISRTELYPVLFSSFQVADKQLRLFVMHHVIQDIRSLHKKRTAENVRAGKKLHAFVLRQLSQTTAVSAAGGDSSARRAAGSGNKGKQRGNAGAAAAAAMTTAAAAAIPRHALDIVVELWRRRVWTDVKTVNGVVNCCFAKDRKVLCAALRFFIGIQCISAEDDQDNDDETMGGGITDTRKKHASAALKDLYRAAASTKGITHKKRKRERYVERARKKIQKRLRVENAALHGETIDNHAADASHERSVVPAIEQIYDPLSFAQRLFSQLKSTGEAFEIRLLMMDVISRLVGTHKLLVLNFYPYIQRMMQPSQRDVTRILLFLARASHDLVPPDVISPCVKTLANHFVTDRSSDAIMAVGLNCIREICARCPLAMTRELLQDLVEYKSHKAKGVMMAARSLLKLFREINPLWLARKDVGRDAAMKMSFTGVRDRVDDEEEEDAGMLSYGAPSAEKDLVGADLLVASEQRRHTGEEGGKAEDEGENDVGQIPVAGEVASASSKEHPAAAAPVSGDVATIVLPAGATRVFSSEEFEKMSQLHAQSVLDGVSKRRKRLREEQEEGLVVSTLPDDIDEDDIVGYVPKTRADKEERLASILEGRVGRDRFGRPKASGGGVTNKEKLKKKAFTMVKHSRAVQGKATGSLKQKQGAMTRHVKTLKKQAKDKHRKRRRRA